MIRTPCIGLGTFSLPIQHSFRGLEMRGHVMVAAEVFSISYIDPVVEVRPARLSGKRTRLECRTGIRLVRQGSNAIVVPSDGKLLLHLQAAQ
jgi:hypothetical protein